MLSNVLFCEATMATPEERYPTETEAFYRATGEIIREGQSLRKRWCYICRPHSVLTN